MQSYEKAMIIIYFLYKSLTLCSKKLCLRIFPVFYELRISDFKQVRAAVVLLSSCFIITRVRDKNILFKKPVSCLHFDKTAPPVFAIFQNKIILCVNNRENARATVSCCYVVRYF